MFYREWLLSKIEKILTSLIIWPYIGVIVGFLLAILIGGRGGMFFVFLGVMAGCVGGFLSSLYIAVKYNEEAGKQSTGHIRIIVRRILVSLLYVFFIYTVAINYFHPVQW